MILSFSPSKSISGKACAVINANIDTVFNFIATNFFKNYTQWAPEVIELVCLDADNTVAVGVKGRQVRDDNGTVVDSTFEIAEYTPHSTFILQGLSSPYKQTYQTEVLSDGNQTQLTFIFELLEIELFMRPFEKLIRFAIEDGAESTVENIMALITSPSDH